MSRRWFRVVVASVSFVAWTGTATAWAQDETPPANFGPPPPGHEPPPPWSPGDSTQPPAPITSDIAPGFMTLDRVDGTTRLGLQASYNKVQDFIAGGEDFLRFNLYGQFVFPGTKGGIYGQIPISYAFLNGDNGTGVGNLEMGGFFLPMGTNDLILRAGLVAATADDDDIAGVAANVGTIYDRLTDFVLAAPNYTTARLSASTIQFFDEFFLRADGGFDLVIDRPNTGGGSPSVFFRANVGAGYRVPGAVDLAFELVNLAAVNGDADGITNRFIHTAGITARTPGVDQFHIGAIVPLDEDVRGDVWIVSGGYQRAFY